VHGGVAVRMEKFPHFILSEEVMQHIGQYYNIDPNLLVVSCIYSKENLSLWKLWNHKKIKETTLETIKTIWKFDLPWICRIEK
jgi:hypothetical protein